MHLNYIYDDSIDEKYNIIKCISTSSGNLYVSQSLVITLTYVMDTVDKLARGGWQALSSQLGGVTNITALCREKRRGPTSPL